MLTGFGRTALAAAGFSSSAILVVSLARAQASAPGPDPLVAARSLFAEALQDEGASRFATALAKFEQVRAVRDTASVEYRIASCHEALGEPARAYGAYRAAVVLGRHDAQGTDVVRASADRLDILAKRVALLTLLPPGRRDGGLEVTVDGVAVDAGESDSIPLLPGRHVVSATSPGATPFRSEIALAEGAQVSLTMNLPPLPDVTTEPVAKPGTAARAPAAWIAVGTGVALSAASVILLVVRHEDIASLDRACPGGRCPPGADANDLQSTRSRALVEGPVGVACGAAGLAAVGVGLYLLTGKRPAPGAGVLSMMPFVGHDGAGLSLAGALR